MYVVFLSKLEKYSKRNICALLQPMTKLICNSMQFRLHVESFKLDMINLSCEVIRISNKCSCVEIFDQQESFKLDMIDLACGVIRISNNVLALRNSIIKVIQSILSLVDFHINNHAFPRIDYYLSSFLFLFFFQSSGILSNFLNHFTLKIFFNSLNNLKILLKFVHVCIFKPRYFGKRDFFSPNL